MGLERLGFEFGVELAAEKPGVVRHFHNFNVVFVGSASGNSEASGDEGFFKFAIKFVTVAVAFADFGLAVSLVRKGAGFEDAGPRSKAHGAAHFVNAKEFAKLVDYAMGSLRIELSAICLVEAGAVAGVFNGGALHSQADSEEGDLVFAGVVDGVDHALNAALAESAGNQDAVVAAQNAFQRSPDCRFPRIQSNR